MIFIHLLFDYMVGIFGAFQLFDISAPEIFIQLMEL
jgi:hypothetical protein